jgi:hypothetical protein
MDIQVPDIAITEKVVRSAGVYRFLLIAFRSATTAPWVAGSSAASSSSRSTGRKAS